MGELVTAGDPIAGDPLRKRQGPGQKHGTLRSLRKKRECWTAPDVGRGKAWRLLESAFLWAGPS